MAQPHSYDIDQRKVAELTVREFSLLIKQIQVDAVEEALKKVIPQTDPDESVFLTVQQAYKMIGISKETFYKKKKKLLIEVREEGRIHRVTLAAVKRYLKTFGKPLSSLKRAEKKAKEEAERKLREVEKIRKSGNRGIT